MVAQFQWFSLRLAFNPEPETLNPNPETRNSNPKPLNPKPLNPNP